MGDLGDWRDRATCREHHDPDIFDGAGKGRAPVEALRECRGCPVRAACLDYALALSSSDDNGLVWGGTTHKARLDIRAGYRTRAEAMADGDRLAEMRTPDEMIAEDEPWLAAS